MTTHTFCFYVCKYDIASLDTVISNHLICSKLSCHFLKPTHFMTIFWCRFVMLHLLKPYVWSLPPENVGNRCCNCKITNNLCNFPDFSNQRNRGKAHVEIPTVKVFRGPTVADKHVRMPISISIYVKRQPGFMLLSRLQLHGWMRDERALTKCRHLMI